MHTPLVATVLTVAVLATPLGAEEFCPSDLAGPGLSYAANTLDATAFVDAALEHGSAHGPANTLLAMHDGLGSDLR